MGPLEAFLGLIGVLVTGVLTYLGVRYTGKQSERAAQETQEDTKRRDAIDGFDRLVKNLFENQKTQGDQIREQADEIRKLKERQTVVDRELEQERAARKAAIRHIIELHTLLEVIPPLPDDIKQYFPEPNGRRDIHSKSRSRKPKEGEDHDRTD